MWIAFKQQGAEYMVNLDKVATIAMAENCLHFEGAPNLFGSSDMLEEVTANVDVIEFTDDNAAKVGWKKIKDALASGVLLLELGECLPGKNGRNPEA